jgi:regulator of RNase E activity RraA
VDGAVVIPGVAAADVATKAEEKVATEAAMRAELRDGRSMREAFVKFKVL